MATINRGDVVVARIPQSSSIKLRPYVVIQTDVNNARLTNVILAMVTTNTKWVGKVQTQVLVELNAANSATGLTRDSAIKCENIFTAPASAVRTIGRLPAGIMQQVDKALKVSLDLNLFDI